MNTNAFMGTSLLVSKPAKQVDAYTDFPYEAYPIQHHVLASGSHLFLEGYVYDERFTISLLLGKAGACEQGLASWDEMAYWLHGFGGEFVCMVHTELECVVINDPLARLPVYYYEDTGVFFAGRCLGRLFAQKQKVPDTLGVAQTLWCGYALSHRTIYQGVHRLHTASLVIYNLKTQQTRLTTFEHVIAYDANKPFQRVLPELVHYFNEGCKCIQQSIAKSPHVSLSGGMDSRAVLAGFMRSGAYISASTYANTASSADVEIAHLLAKEFEIGHGIFPVGNDVSYDEIIAIKQGLNYTGMSFILPYLDWIGRTYPHAYLLTGDGGDKMLPYLGDGLGGKTLSQLVTAIVHRHRMADAMLAATTAGVHPDDLQHSIVSVLENDFKQFGADRASVLYTIKQRAAKAYFEGEDRNRYYLWSTTPFYYLPFVKLAMQVIDGEKKGYKAYVQFLNLLDERLLKIKDAGGYRAGGTAFQLKKRLQEVFRTSSPVLKDLLREINAGSPHTTAVPALPLKSAAFVQSDDAALKYIQAAGTEAKWHFHTLQQSFA